MATKKLTERQRFEKWYLRGVLRDVRLLERAGLGYRALIPNEAWKAWQASARAKR